MSLRVLNVIVAMLLAQPAAAQQEPLFVHRVAVAADALGTSIASRAEVVSRAVVGMQIDRLFGPQGVASRVVLNTGPQTWTARFERLDTDTAGFRSWVGNIEGIVDSHVVFTERDGVISGLINAVGTTYQVRTGAPGTYFLEQVDVTRLGDERDPIAVSDTVGAALDAPALTADDGGTIDVLMLYTPSARAQRGGSASIESLVSQVISDTNTAFARSGVVTRVRLVAAREFAMVENAAMGVDLFTVRAQAEPLRDELGADLVQLLVNSPDLSTCGVGYLLESLGSTNFPAYSVADISCAAQYTPTHEMGHNLGSHHAPEDAAWGALFPYSYGFKDTARGFRTVMAYGCDTAPCGRILNFSSPRITYLGGVTGTGDRQDNARSISEAAFTVANFRRSAAAEPLVPPSAPTGLRSFVNGTAVTVAWDAVAADDAAYYLQVGTLAGAADVFFASTGSATSASGLLADGVYFWRVIAFNLAGPSSPSTEAQFTVGTPCVTPSPPRDFIFGVTGSHVTLSWTPPVTASNPVTYIVDVGSAPGAVNVLVAPVGSITAVGTPAPPGTYYVRVRAQNPCGTSLPSNEQIITVP
jgi:peptidyl-Asp metalloendopeptidase